MREAGTSARVLLRGLAQAAAAIGVDRARLCAELGIQPSDLDSDQPIPTLLLARAWRVAPELSGDPLFGLHAGAHATIGTYDVLDYLFSTSSTLGEACRAIERYHRVITEAWRVDLVVDHGTARFRHWVPADIVEPLRHAWDFFFSGSLQRIRSLLQQPMELVAIHLMTADPGPELAPEYQRVLGCTVRFDQPIGEFVFDARYLAAPLVSANPALGRLVRRHAEDLLARIPSESDLLARARAALSELLGEPGLSIRLLARKLGVSERTLQRKLAEREITYTDLVDKTREELALRHLEAGAISISELGFRLGFGSLAAFTRAFQRWQGTSPREYQRRARALLVQFER